MLGLRLERETKFFALHVLVTRYCGKTAWASRNNTDSGLTCWKNIFRIILAKYIRYSPPFASSTLDESSSFSILTYYLIGSVFVHIRVARMTRAKPVTYVTLKM